MNFDINITGLDTLAASISDLADALKAGVTANQIIDGAKQSSRKPRTPAPAAAPVVETKTYPDGTEATGAAPLPEQSPKEQAAPEVGKPDPTPAATAEMAPVEATPTSAAPSEPAAIIPAHEAEAATFGIANAPVDETSEEFLTARGLVLALSKTKGREITLATLAPFGVERISQIKDVATLLAFSAAAQKVLA